MIRRFGVGRPRLVIAIAVILPLLVAAGAQAQDPNLPFCTNGVPPCNVSDPLSECYRAPAPPATCGLLSCGNCTKSPCYVGSGIYTAEEIDLVVATIGLPITVSRLYQSSHSIDGEVGYGWVSGLSARLYHTQSRGADGGTGSTEVHVRIPDGTLYKFTENPENGSFTPQPGRFDRLVHNVDGTWDFRLQRSQSRYRYAATGDLLEMIDDYGNTLAWSYRKNRLYRISDVSGSGRYVEVTWGGDGRLSDVTDSGGRTIHYQYEGDRLATVENPLAQKRRYSYRGGKYGQLLGGIRDHWNREITAIVYDAQDRVTSYTENEETYSYGYADGGNGLRTRKTSSAGSWLFEFNAAGLVTSAWPPGAAPAGPPARTEYDANGLVISRTDPENYKTTMTYDGEGNPLTVTYFGKTGTALVRFQFEYDPVFTHKLTKVTAHDPTTGAIDRNWQGWKRDYYPPGSPAPGQLHNLYTLDADGVTARLVQAHTYDSHGRILTITNALGKEITYAWADELRGDLKSITMPPNNDDGISPMTKFEHDGLGRVTSMTDADERTTTFSYDGLDRMTSMTLPKPVVGSLLDFTTVWTYDELDSESGLLFARVTGPGGASMRTGYDQYGRAIVHYGTTGDVLKAEYVAGALTALLDGNGSRTGYEYDNRGRLRRVVYADGTAESYSYYGNDMISGSTDRAGQAMTYTYDAFKRLLVRQYQNGRTTTNTYAGQKLEHVVDIDGLVSEQFTNTWNDRFQLIASDQSGRGTLRMTYNADGGIATRSVDDGPTVTLDYYPNGNLRSMNWSPISPGQFKFEYTRAGRQKSIEFPNGQSREYVYDDLGRPTQVANRLPGGGVLAAFSYGYDVNPFTGVSNLPGDQTSVTMNIPSLGLADAITSRSYDQRRFLSRVDYPAQAPYNGMSTSWTYDAEGNRRTETVNGSTVAYQYAQVAGLPGPRLQSDGSNSYSYDVNGNVVGRTGSRGTFTFGYDHDSLLRSISGDVSMAFDYDYLGRRSGSTTGGATTTYLYEDVHAIRETTGATKTDYLFAPGYDQALAMVRDGTVYYYGVDVRGTVWTVNDAAGEVKNAYAWDAWGKRAGGIEEVSNPLGYTGRESSVAGLQFSRFRFYEPATGRFLSEDPQYAVGGLNTYLYANADPVYFTDPLGLQAGAGASGTVTVCLYPQGAGGAGHLGFGTGNSPGTRGKYPAEGVLWDDQSVLMPDMLPEKRCFAIPVLPVVEKCMTECQTAPAGAYAMLNAGMNCTGFVRQCMTYCGLNAGGDQDVFPRTTYKRMKRLNPHKPMPPTRLRPRPDWASDSPTDPTLPVSHTPGGYFP